MDAKERREKIKQATLQTLSESGTIKLSFSEIKKEWDLEINEILGELKEEDKVELSGVGDWQLKIGERGFELGGLNGD